MKKKIDSHHVKAQLIERNIHKYVGLMDDSHESWVHYVYFDGTGHVKRHQFHDSIFCNRANL